MKNLTLLLIVLSSFSAFAQWPGIELEKVAGPFFMATHVTNAGDDRLFVCEKRGTIRIVKEGQITNTFLDIQDRCTIKKNEQGLLSLAFPPKHKNHFYIMYSDLKGDNQLSRFKIDPQNPDHAIISSEEKILNIKQPRGNHNGGPLAFGPDGTLYIGLGDSGGGGDPDNVAQNRKHILGNILRIDVEGKPDIGKAYAIPPSNPFVGNSEGWHEEIWAWGIRNPWRMSFDRLTGDLYFGDVGQNKQEEINFQSADSKGGENYGWDCYEGLLLHDARCKTSYPIDKMIPPISTHGRKAGCSITGGHIFRGDKNSPLYGIYFYADYCTGKIWGLEKRKQGWRSKELLDTKHSISSFGEDHEGNIYVLSYHKDSGDLFKLKAK